MHTSSYRSSTYEDIPNDEYGFCTGKGVAHVMVTSCRLDYKHMFLLVEDSSELEPEDSTISYYMDEIHDSKWLIHAYDLEGTLN